MMPPDRPRRLLWTVGLPVLCALSALAYAVFSQLARANAQSLSYILYVFHNSPSGFEPLYLMLFAASCMLTGALTGRQLRPWFAFGPTCWLFAIASAVVPPQILTWIFWPDGQGTIRSTTLLLISLSINGALAIWALRSRVSYRMNHDAEPPSAFGWGYLFLGLTAILYAMVFFSALGTVTGADALAFHLPRVASWVKTGSLTGGTDIQFQYPENFGLLLRWILASRADGAVFFAPFVCSLLCIYLLYCIGRTSGFSREVATVCACCAAVCPPFVHLSTTAYNESFACLCLLLAVYYLLQWDDPRQEPWPYAICIGLSIGMAAGAKASLLPMVGVLLCCAMVAAWIRVKYYPDRLAALGILAFVALASGACWYVRNLALFGNPVYPLAFAGLPGVKLEILLGPNLLVPDWKAILYPWWEYDYKSPFDDGVGAVFAGLCVPAIVLSPFLLWRSRRDPATATFALKLVCWIVLADFAVAILLRNITPRYMLPAILLSSVLIGFLWTESASRHFRFMVLLPFSIMVVVLGTTFFSNCLYKSNTPYQTGAERFGMPKLLDEIQPARILNAGWQYSTYGLLGRDYRHDVVTFFRDATPDDAVKYQVEYVWLRDALVPEFQAKLNMALLAKVDSGPAAGHSLWRILQTPNPR